MIYRTLGSLVFSCFILGGCDGNYAGKRLAPEGERIPVLALETSLKPDPALEAVEVRLPRPFSNLNWSQDGGSPDNAMHHLAISDHPTLNWRASIGKKGGKKFPLLVKPVVFNGTVFTMDSMSFVEARHLRDGSGLWRVGLAPRDGSPGVIGGGLAAGQGVIYAITGYGSVFALNAKNGSLLWNTKLGVPLRGAPLISEGKIFVLAIDNRLFALDAETGTSIWMHAGVPESTGIVGAGSAAYDRGLVVVPYSSGKIFALGVSGGRVAWSDNLIPKRAKLTLAQLNDINSRPVIDRGTVYAIGTGGRMLAINLQTGSRIWVRDLSAQGSPWIAGDFLFLITQDNELIALSRSDGLVRWLTELPLFQQPKKKKGRIVWVGPILASDRLIVISSMGEMLAVSPYTGKILGSMELNSGTFVEPVLADGTLLVLTNDGFLSAYR